MKKLLLLSLPGPVLRAHGQAAASPGVDVGTATPFRPRHATICAAPRDGTALATDNALMRSRGADSPGTN